MQDWTYRRKAVTSATSLVSTADVTIKSPGACSEVFFSHARLHGGPAPVRQFLPELINRNWR